MAIFQPAFALQRVGADWTLTAAITGDVSAHSMRAVFRDQVGSGGTSWATKTTGGGGIVATYSAPTTSVVITLDDTDTDGLTPGAYVWKLERTDAGGEFDYIDWSTVFLTPDTLSEAPQLVNYSQVVAGSRGVLSETVNDTDAKFYLPIIAAAEAAFRHLVGKNISFGTYVEYLDAPTRGGLFVRETPVTAVSEVRFDASGGFGQLTDSFATATALTSGTDYFLRKDRPDGLSYSGEVFTTRPGGWSWWGAQGRYTQQVGLLATSRVAIPGAFKITYTGGWRLVPADIAWCIVTMVNQFAARGIKGMPLQSESGERYSYTLGSLSEETMRLDSVQAVIQRYRRGDMYVG